MSLLEMLKDKVNYKIFKALDDPEAATFAAEKAQQKAEQDAKEQKQQKQQEAKTQREKELAEAEANKPKSPVSAARAVFLQVIVYGIGAFLILVCGSLTANTAIHRHPLLRILYFVFGSIFGLILLIFALPIPIIPPILLVLYIILYMLDWLPHYYNFLPLMQYKPTTNIFYGALQNYVIAWNPSDERHKNEYEIKMKDYLKILSSSLAAPAEGVKEEAK